MFAAGSEQLLPCPFLGRKCHGNSCQSLRSCHAEERPGTLKSYLSGVYNEVCLVKQSQAWKQHNVSTVVVGTGVIMNSLRLPGNHCH